MNISSVNFVNNSNNIYKSKQTQKTPSFEGLWGKTSSVTDQDPALGIIKTKETYYYYPFRDETKAEVNQIVNDHSSENITDEDEPRYLIKDCRVCSTLPYTSNQFEEYATAPRITKANLLIHEAVKNLYLNNAYGDSQASATNDIFIA